MKLRNKVVLLGSLYLAQGLPFGFFTQALPVLLREQGVSLAGIGASSLLALPWALKFLWAPAVDSFGSRRKQWIVPLQLASVLLLVGLSFLDPAEGLMWLLVGFFFTNLLAASQDIATDGLAVDLLSYGERGLGNGVQVAGYRLGMIVGGGLLLVLFDVLGWQATFLLMGGILLFSTLPVTRYAEPVRAAADRPGSMMEAALAFVRRPGAWGWLGMIMAYKAGGALASGMLRPMLVDLGYEMGDIGVILGTAGFVAGLLGALVGGALVPVLGRRRALILFGVGEALTSALYALPALGWDGLWTVGTLSALEHFIGGMSTAALFTVMMDATKSESAASDYTIQASAVVLASGLGVAMSGVLAGTVGYAYHFAIAGVVALGGVWVAAVRYRSAGPKPSRG